MDGGDNTDPLATALAIIAGIGCCSTLLLITGVLGLVFWVFLLKKAIKSYNEWYVNMRSTWGKRMFDNPDLLTFSRWFQVIGTFAPLQLRDEDKALALRVNELLKEEQGLSEEEASKVDDMQMHMSTADRLPPVRPGGEATEEIIKTEVEYEVPIVPLVDVGDE